MQYTIFKTYDNNTPEEDKALQEYWESDKLDRLQSQLDFDLPERLDDDTVLTLTMAQWRQLHEALEQEDYDEWYAEDESSSLECAKGNLKSSGMNEIKGTLVAFVRGVRWNGSGSRWEIKSNELTSIFDFGKNEESLNIWYDDADEEIRSIGIHHDGRSNYLWRELPQNIAPEELEEKLYQAGSTARAEQVFMEMTVSIGPYFEKLYGWKQKAINL